MLYRNILLIDDDADDVELLQDALNSIGDPKVFQTAANRNQALDVLQKSETVPDLIFLDLNIPGVVGTELLQIIKTTPKTQDVPVVLFSSHKKEVIQELARPYEAAYYISKPNSYQELLGVLREILA